MSQPPFIAASLALPRALAAGVALAGRRFVRRAADLRRRPGPALFRMGFEALSLAIHPIRNAARAMQAIAAWARSPRRRRWLQVGEVIAWLCLLPTVVPWIAEGHAMLARFERSAERARRARHVRLGHGAPLGSSSVGSAVNRAVWGTPANTVPVSQALTRGHLEAIWRNSPDQPHRALTHVTALIYREAEHAIALQTYLFDPTSAPARELLQVLAQKQRDLPDFQVSVIADTAGLARALAKAGIKAQVAIGRPVWSRRGQHTKLFVIDGRIGILGGENLNDPRQSDLMVAVTGPVVRSMLAEFDDAWRHAARIPGPPPQHPAPTAEPSRATVPMTCLGKAGVSTLWTPDPYDNTADHALLAAIDAARHLIKIQTPNLNAGSVLRALARAVHRGVEIRLCVPLNFNLLTSALDATSNHALLAFWSDLSPRSQERFLIRNYSTNGRMAEPNHTKFLSIDGQWAYIGSQNLDNQSFAYSREFGLGIDDPFLTKRLEAEVFDPDWATSLSIRPGWWAELLPYMVYDR